MTTPQDALQKIRKQIANCEIHLASRSNMAEAIEMLAYLKSREAYYVGQEVKQ